MSPNNRHNTGTIACVVDTECSYITKNPRMIFHFGATFGDLEQEHSFNVIKMDYYVKEVMQDLDLFLHQNREGHNYSYNQSMARALKDAIENPYKVKSWRDIIDEWQEKLYAMNVEYLTSYNFNFDIGVDSSVGGTMRKTHQQLTDKTFYLPRNVDYVCLMDIAGTLFMNNNYNRWLDSLTKEELDQMTTAKGNPSYSAESCIRYLNKDLWYREQHTALRDSLLEFQLFSHFWKKWKNTIKREFVNNVRPVHWSNIKKGYSAKKKLELRRGKVNKIKKKSKSKNFDPNQLELTLNNGGGQ